MCARPFSSGCSSLIIIIYIQFHPHPKIERMRSYSTKERSYGLGHLANGIGAFQYEFGFQLLDTIQHAISFVIALQANTILEILLAKKRIDLMQGLVFLGLILVSVPFALAKEKYVSQKEAILRNGVETLGNAATTVTTQAHAMEHLFKGPPIR